MDKLVVSLNANIGYIRSPATFPAAASPKNRTKWTLMTMASDTPNTAAQLRATQRLPQ